MIKKYSLPLLVSLFLIGCVRSTSLEYRLQGFYALLDDQALVEKFTAGDIPAVAAAISKRLSTDKNFSAAYRTTLKREAIEFFSPKQLTSFFYHSVYLRIYPSRTRTTS